MEQSTLIKIAKEYGSPVYVYDAHKIEDQYKRLTQAFSKVKNLKIHYAAKALTNISVLKFVSKLGAALDTVSIQEVQLGLKAGFAAERIIYTPNGVSLKEIEAVAALGSNACIDPQFYGHRKHKLDSHIPLQFVYYLTICVKIVIILIFSLAIAR